MAGEKPRDCSGTNNTYELNICYGGGAYGSLDVMSDVKSNAISTVGTLGEPGMGSGIRFGALVPRNGDNRIRIGTVCVGPAERSHGRPAMED